MIPLGLTGAQEALFARHLASSHTLVTTAHVLDLSEDTISNVSQLVLDGQVNVDADADVTRSMSMTLLDRTHALNFDSDSPDDGTLYLDRMLKVEQSFLVPTVGRVDVPIFTGPVVKFDRDGDEVSVECHGKEALALTESWRPLHLSRGTRKTEAIKTILGERAGEERFAFPELRSQRLQDPVNLGRLHKPWLAAQDIAESMNRQLFYDGDGVCRMRERPATSAFTFSTEGDRPNITGNVQITKDGTRLRNVVWVKGGKRTGKRTGSATYAAIAPRNHPLSPWALGRNGTPRYFVEVVENDSIRTDADARRLAERVLRNRLLDVTEVTADTLPVPHLDPLDVVRFEVGDYAANIVLRKFTLPITVGGDMSVGTIRRRSVNRKRIRR